MNVKMQKIVLSSMYTKCKCELGCWPHCEPVHKNNVEMEDNAYELHAILHFLSDNHVCLSCHCVKIINSWEKGSCYCVNYQCTTVVLYS